MTDTRELIAIARLVDEGQLDEAGQALDAVLASGRPDGRVHALEGRLLLARRQPAEACGVLEQAVQMIPGDPLVWNDLGRALNNLGQPHEAVTAFEQATRLAPRFADALNNLGHVQRILGLDDDARRSFEAAVAADPAHAGARANYGAALLAAGDAAGAIVHLDKAARALKRQFQVHYNLALALHESGRLGEAADAYRAALALAPRDPAAWSNLGSILTARHDLTGAREAFDAAIAVEPEHVAALTGLAGIAELEGNTRQAEQLLLRALATGRTDVGLNVAHARLLLRQGRYDQARSSLETALNDNPPGVASAAMIHYTLGDIDDAAGQYADAFEHYRRANALRPGRWDPVRHADWIDHLLAVYTRQRLDALTPASTTRPRPVFIVGMPRSGTSLVEQILASHPDVFGAGELPALGRAAAGLGAPGSPYPLCLTHIGRDELAAAAASYLAELDRQDSSRRYVTDKMWQNFEHLGLIQLLFGTDVRVVHCRRHPLDTLVSCFFQSFGSVGLAFANDLEHLAAYYRQYRRLIEHWARVSRLDILAVDYERLVADQENQTRRMVDWLGLAWDPACLSFHRTRRTVLTASSDQVRQPMHDRSVGRHGHYRKFLGPIVEGLNLKGE